MTHAPQPSEEIRAVARARAQLHEAEASVRAIVAVDVSRWTRLVSRLAGPLFNPVLATVDLEPEDLHAEEAIRLAENVVNAMARLHRHLSQSVG